MRGIGARSWLTAESLDVISRLGVARLLWHVGAADRLSALGSAERLAAPGRAALEVVDLEQPTLAFELRQPPALPPAPLTLAAAFDALQRAARPTARDNHPLAERLAALTGYGGAPLLRPDARASLLVLRPRDASASRAEALEIETVFLDGREVRGPR